MADLIRIGIDTSKSVFHLHGVNAREEVVLQRKLGRKGLISFLRALPATVIGLEACGGSQHWGRLFMSFGHEVKLMAPQRVKPYVARSKTDAADAAALCEAMSRPSMPFVPVKSPEAQAALMLLGMRDQVLRQRTRLANAIRGHAAEFGLCGPRGLCKIEPLLAQIAEAAEVPELARDLFGVLGRQFDALNGQVRQLEGKLRAWHQSNEMSRRLAALPGVGSVGACMLVLKTPDAHSFRSGRQFAAWMGLTPKDHSTGGKSRQGRITRAGDKALRAVLVAGATSRIQQVRHRRGKPFPWLEALLERKPPKLAAVALANKTARVAWKLMVTQERYEGARFGP